MAKGYALPAKYADFYLTITGLYRQQKYMFDNHTHRVEGRIVGISQPYLRPVVQGKAKNPTEFGAKYDVSIDEKGHARLEKIQFDPYNESSVFQKAVEAYYQRNGRILQRALVDQIYRTREREPRLLQRTWNPDVGAKAWQTVQEASTKEKNTRTIQTGSKWNASSTWTNVAVEQETDHDQAVGYNTVIDCPVGVCNESIRNPCRQYFFALFCRKQKADQIPSISSNSKQRNLSPRVSKAVRDFGERLC